MLSMQREENTEQMEVNTCLPISKILTLSPLEFRKESTSGLSNARIGILFLDAGPHGRAIVNDCFGFNFMPLIQPINTS